MKVEAYEAKDKSLFHTEDERDAHNLNLDMYKAFIEKDGAYAGIVGPGVIHMMLVFAADYVFKNKSTIFKT